MNLKHLYGIRTQIIIFSSLYYLMLVFLFLTQSDRLQKVQDNLCTLRSLCSVLGLDFKQTVSEVHPSLGNSEGSKSVNNGTISQLALATQKLRGVKLQRMQKV